MAGWPVAELTHGSSILAPGVPGTWVAELTTGHITVVTLYVNAGTWSLMY